jgi:hypothetical protein
LRDSSRRAARVFARRVCGERLGENKPLVLVKLGIEILRSLKFEAVSDSIPKSKAGISI